MEGALPSVVAGLVSKPVIAVPTSVGYGANFGGLAPLLGMLNSCASGLTVQQLVTVVHIYWLHYVLLTVRPLAQLLSMPSSGASPLKLAP